MYYIYKITNKINNKLYIGITENIKDRWSNHTSDYTIETIKRPLYSAMKKHGKENFVIEVLTEISSKEKAQSEEIRLISELQTLWTQNGYNISPGGSIPSIENRKNVSEKMKNNNPMKTLRTNRGSFKPGQKPKITPERNEKIRLSKIGKNNPNYGNKSAADHLQTKMTCEHCNKTISRGNYFRWHGDKCKSI